MIGLIPMHEAKIIAIIKIKVQTITKKLKSQPNINSIIFAR